MVSDRAWHFNNLGVFLWLLILIRYTPDLLPFPRSRYLRFLSLCQVLKVYSQQVDLLLYKGRVPLSLGFKRCPTPGGAQCHLRSTSLAEKPEGHSWEGRHWPPGGRMVTLVPPACSTVQDLAGMGAGGGRRRKEEGEVDDTGWHRGGTGKERETSSMMFVLILIL